MNGAYRNQGLIALAALLVGGAGGYAVARLTSSSEREQGIGALENSARIEFDEAALAAALVQGIDERFGAILARLASAPLGASASGSEREAAIAPRSPVGDGAQQERLTAVLAGVERALARGDRHGSDADSGRWSIAAGSDALSLDAFGSRELRSALIDGEEWAENAWSAGLRGQLLLATPNEVVAWLGWPQTTGAENSYAYWAYDIADRDAEWQQGTPVHTVTIYFQGGVVMSVESDVYIDD